MAVRECWLYKELLSVAKQGELLVLRPTLNVPSNIKGLNSLPRPCYGLVPWVSLKPAIRLALQFITINGKRSPA